ncbi:hypothetical protein BDD12DRAFT_153641 [Trichophaea hybrida]|nr:hypothetical protein BDD12DRAFT_153641 [Trichophaea hybrida]
MGEMILGMHLYLAFFFLIFPCVGEGDCTTFFLSLFLFLFPPHPACLSPSALSTYVEMCGVFSFRSYGVFSIAISYYTTMATF